MASSYALFPQRSIPPQPQVRIGYRSGAPRVKSAADPLQSTNQKAQSKSTSKPNPLELQIDPAPSRSLDWRHVRNRHLTQHRILSSIQLQQWTWRTPKPPEKSPACGSSTPATRKSCTNISKTARHRTAEGADGVRNMHPESMRQHSQTAYRFRDYVVKFCLVPTLET